MPACKVVPWFDPDILGNDALKQFAPENYGGRLKAWRVGDGAKRSANDDASLIAPIDEAAGQLFV